MSKPQSNESNEAKAPSRKLTDLQIVASELQREIKAHIVNVGEFEPKEVIVSPEVVHSILKSAYVSGAKNKVNVLNSNGEMAILTGQQFKSILPKEFDPIVSNHKALADLYLKREIDKLEKKGAKETKEKEKPRRGRPPAEKGIEPLLTEYPWQVLFDYIVLKRQAECEVSHIDPWLAKPFINIVEKDAHIHQKAGWPKILGTQNDALAADFKKHFPELDEFIEWLIASRFCKDRKQCYLWLHCPSDWGKSLLLSILRESGMALALNMVEARKAFNGDPLALRREQFRSPIAIVFDEFDRVISEMKLLQNEMYISPKFGSRAMVPLYAKVFMSKESVASLGVEQGIEEQMANRMCYIEGKGVLSKRPLFMQSKIKYAEGLSHYVTSQLKAGFDQYVAMGPERAGETAQAIVERFYLGHNIGKFYGRFNDHIEEHAESFGKWIYDTYSDARDDYRVTTKAHKAMINNLSYDSHKRAFYLKSPRLAFDLWVDECFSPSVQVAMKRAYSELAVALSADGNGVATHRLANSPNIRAVKLRPSNAYTGDA